MPRLLPTTVALLLSLSLLPLVAAQTPKPKTGPDAATKVEPLSLPSGNFLVVEFPRPGRLLDQLGEHFGTQPTATFTKLRAEIVRQFGFDPFDAEARAKTGLDFSGPIRFAYRGTPTPNTLIFEVGIADRRAITGYFGPFHEPSAMKPDAALIVRQSGKSADTDQDMVMTITNDRCFFTSSAGVPAVDEMRAWGKVARRAPLSKDADYIRGRKHAGGGTLATIHTDLRVALAPMGLDALPIVAQSRGLTVAVSDDGLQIHLALEEKSAPLALKPTKPVTEFLARCPEPSVCLRLNVDDVRANAELLVTQFGLPGMVAGFGDELRGMTGVDTETWDAQLKGSALAFLLYPGDREPHVVAAVRVADAPTLRKTMEQHFSAAGPLEVIGDDVLFPVDGFGLGFIDGHLVASDDRQLLRQRATIPTEAKWHQRAHSRELIGIDLRQQVLTKLFYGRALGIFQKLLLIDREWDAGSLYRDGDGLTYRHRFSKPVELGDWLKAVAR